MIVAASCCPVVLSVDSLTTLTALAMNAFISVSADPLTSPPASPASPPAAAAAPDEDLDSSVVVVLDSSPAVVYEVIIWVVVVVDDEDEDPDDDEVNELISKPAPGGPIDGSIPPPPLLDVDDEVIVVMRAPATSVAPGGPIAGKEPPLVDVMLEVPNTLMLSLPPAPGAMTIGNPLCAFDTPRKAPRVINLRFYIIINIIDIIKYYLTKSN